MKQLKVLLCLAALCAIASGQVFSASTASVVSSSATPAFSLSAVSSQSPIVFTISPVTNVTGPTITNLSAGAAFSIIVTSDGTHTWTWNGIIADNVCPIYTDAVAKTYASFVVDPNGTTIHGDSCWTNLAGAVAYGATVAAASSNPSSGNMLCNLTSVGFDCLSSAGVHYVMPAVGTGVLTFLATPSGANFNAMIQAGGVPIAQGSHSAAYTTVMADGSLQLLHPTADNNPLMFTIDSNANVAYPVGTVLTFVNQINTLTIAITADTLTLAGTATTGSRTLAVGGFATAVKITSTIWFIGGAGLT